MIYELRIYECHAGKLDVIHDRFADRLISLLERYGIRNVGYWTHDVGPGNNQLVYLVAFRDHGHRAEAWAGVASDPEWLRIYEEANRDADIVRHVESRLLVPTDYSPMQ